MEQSSLENLSSQQLFSVKVYRSNTLLARCGPEAQASASLRRRSLVKILSRSPLSTIQWEEDPRATGWYGLRSNNPVTIYHITVEKDSGVSTDD